MARLERSLVEMRMANPHSREQWHGIAMGLIGHGAKAAGVAPEALHQLVYIQVTRGVAMRDHVMPPDITPTVFAMASPMRPPTPEQLEHGVACVSADDFRWEKAHIKSTSLLGSVFARQISFDAGALETVMFRRGYLSEAAASNVWVVKDGTVYGTPKDNLVLEEGQPGARGHSLRPDRGVVQVAGHCVPAQAHQPRGSAGGRRVAAFQRDQGGAACHDATLDGEPVGNPAHKGQPGPIARQLHAAYQDAKQADAD